MKFGHSLSKLVSPLRLAQLGLGALALLALAGCEKSPDAAAGAGPAPAGKKLRVVYIPKNTGNPYFAEVVRGFQDAAPDANVEFSTTAPDTADATSQLSYIRDQIQRGVDVLAITPNSPDALVPALDEARAKGVVVVAVDADFVGNESHRDAAVLPADFSTIGPSQVELLGRQIGYAGDVAILSATRDAPNQNVWIADMKRTLALPKYAKMKLVDVVYGDDKNDKSATETEGLLSKYPNLRGLIAPTTAGLAAAAQTIQVAGVYPGGPHAAGAGLVLTGLGTPNQMRGYLEKGVLQSFQLWSPHDMGYLACELAADLKRGETKPADGGKFKAGKLGEGVFTKDGVVYAGPLVTFDKSTIANYKF